MASVNTSSLCFDRILPDDVHRSLAGKPVTRRQRQPDGPDAPVALNTVVFVRKAWPTGKTVRVFFMEDHEDRDKVLPMAAEWSRYCSITFQEVAIPGESDVRVRFNSFNGSWSYLGTDVKKIPLESHTMNLGVVDEATVLHEFGHVLGLIHEHQSPMKGGFDWNREAVTKSLSGAPNYWSEAVIEKNIFERYSQDDVDGTPYDTHSIMHYAYPKEWLKQRPGGPVPHDIPRNIVLSDMDKSFIARIYGPPSATRPPHVALPATQPLQTPYSKSSKPLHDEVTDYPYEISAGKELIFSYKTSSDGPHIYTIETHGPVDLAMTLYGPDDPHHYVTSDDESGVGRNAKIVVKLKPDSTYHVEIRAFGSSGGNFNLTLTTALHLVH